MTLRVLSLFAGIGGFDLGLERTGGFKTVAFCEIDPFCQRVLKKHWPEVPCYDDVRQLSADRLRTDGIAVDVIVGGFPCQDISDAGFRVGIEGERSGLWAEYARLIGEFRPLYVIVENVSALLSRGLDTVLGDLASIGFDAEWHCIPASAIGAPHRRDRLWLIAYPGSQQHEGGCPSLSRSIAEELSRANMAEPSRELLNRSGDTRAKGWSESSDRCEAMGDAAGSGSQRAAQAGIYRREEGPRSRNGEPQRSGWWAVEPDVGRVAHGVPRRVDRLKSLGNAVVPHLPELIGNAILAAMREQKEAA
jgi:DNA (cytosine-5)-methyltransferase 1